MRYEVRIGGFGGQGVITMGHLLGTAASLYLGFKAVMTESYGPEARGGASKTDLVISDVPIDYPKTIILDCLVAMNPDAYNSYIGDLRKGGIVIFNSSLFEVANRFEGVTYLAIPATKLAQEIGAPQATNVIMLGAVAAVSRIIKIDALRKAVTERFPKAVSLNMKALEAGYTRAK